MKEMKEKTVEENSKRFKTDRISTITGNLKKQWDENNESRKRALMMWNSQQIKPPKPGFFILVACLHTVCR